MKILNELFFEELHRQIGNLPDAMTDDELEHLVSSSIQDALPELTSLLKSSLINSSAEMLVDRRTQQREFRERNIKRWKPAFDLFETFIVICTEAGEMFNSENRGEAVKEGDLVFDLSVRLHARACLITREVLTLMENGFPDGAQARWRALHEVTTTALFLHKHGQECAERFYWHDVVESFKGMKQHKKYEDRLNEKAPSEFEIAQCKASYDLVLEKYGKPFAQPFGWAAQSLSRNRVNFALIEEDVELDHMRPYYKWASQNIHSGAKSTNLSLALAETKEDVLLVGPSNSGMTDPAHASAISLGIISTSLLSLRLNLDSVVLMNIIKELMDDIGRAFLNCDSTCGVKE